MPAIGIYDAKTQLAKRLERVSRGERFVITKHRRPAAELVPVGVIAARDVKQTIQQIEEWQQQEGPTLGPGLMVRDLLEAGRRF